MATKILKAVYKGVSQADLLAYAANVLRCCQDQPALDARLQPDVAALAVAHDELREALSAQVNGGRLERDRKNRALAQLRSALNRLAQTVEYFDLGIQTILQLGFTPAAQTSVRNAGRLDPPRDLRGTSTGIGGECELTFRVAEAKRVQTNVVEYSVDRGASWQVVEYSRLTRIRLRGLPSQQVLQFRVASIGSDGRGAWSEPVTLFVA
jgi:hypothetical protein